MKRLFFILCLIIVSVYFYGAQYTPVPIYQHRYLKDTIIYYNRYASVNPFIDNIKYTVQPLNNDGIAYYPYDYKAPMITRPKRSLDFGDDEDDRSIGELLPAELDTWGIIFILIMCLIYVGLRNMGMRDK